MPVLLEGQNARNTAGSEGSFVARVQLSATESTSVAFPDLTDIHESKRGAEGLERIRPDNPQGREEFGM